MANQSFGEMLKEQRWDDHRYYHHSLINQSLHVVSACSFLVAYIYLLIDPVVSALIAWLISMTSRQAGHFFFEPKGYDYVNDASHEYKEAIKVGYNIRRKVVLMAIWAFAPIVLWFEPSLFGMIEPAVGFKEWVRDVGQFWFMLGIGGLGFRVIQLGLRDGGRQVLYGLQKSLLTHFMTSSSTIAHPSNWYAEALSNEEKFNLTLGMWSSQSTSRIIEPS